MHQGHLVGLSRCGLEQEILICTDVISMAMSNISTLAGIATGLKNLDIGLQLAAAVSRQILDQQQQQAAALLKMMKQSNAVVDGHVDTYA